MRKIILCFLVVLIALFSCNKDEISDDGNNFVLVGIAENLKSGACVVSDDIVYQVDGVVAWDENTVKRKIRVEGKFVVELLLPKDSTQMPPYDYRLIVKNPKW